MNTAIVVCTHAGMAEGIRSSVEMICGKQEDFYTVGFEEGEDMMALSGRLAQLAESIKSSGKEFLFFVDLYGATPFNASAAALAAMDAAVIAGVNLPMLLEAVTGRESGCGALELAEEALDGGRSGIRLIKMREMFNNLN